MKDQLKFNLRVKNFKLKTYLQKKTRIENLQSCTSCHSFGNYEIDLITQLFKHPIIEF